jgi:hypothetical protein
MENQYTLTIRASLDDKDFDEITITAQLKPGIGTKNVSSFAVERAVLRWAADHMPTWADYCSTNGMKTLG